MIQHSTTTFELQHRHNFTSTGEFTIWMVLGAGMYRPAQELAYEGRAMEAIRTAEEIRVANYGTMEGLEFRVMKRKTTVILAENASPDRISID